MLWLQSCFSVECGRRDAQGDWCSSDPVSDGVSACAWFLWTFLCRRRFDTTEKCRPQPSTSHENAAEKIPVSHPDRENRQADG